jgi:hypothetical protein
MELYLTCFLSLNKINVLFKGVNPEEVSSKNVHILDETLYINSITEEQNGEYGCSATNQAGTGYSNTLALKVASKNTTLIKNKQSKYILQSSCL